MNVDHRWPGGIARGREMEKALWRMTQPSSGQSVLIDSASVPPARTQAHEIPRSIVPVGTGYGDAAASESGVESPRSDKRGVDRDGERYAEASCITGRPCSSGRGWLSCAPHAHEYARPQG